MDNPLEPIIERYRLASDCLRVTQRVIRGGIDRAITGQRRALAKLSPGAAHVHIDDAQLSLDRLAVLELTAVFERVVRTRLVQHLSGRPRR